MICQLISQSFSKEKRLNFNDRRKIQLGRSPSFNTFLKKARSDNDSVWKPRATFAHVLLAVTIKIGYIVGLGSTRLSRAGDIFWKCFLKDGCRYQILYCNISWWFTSNISFLLDSGIGTNLCYNTFWTVSFSSKVRSFCVTVHLHLHGNPFPASTLETFFITSGSVPCFVNFWVMGVSGVAVGHGKFVKQSSGACIICDNYDVKRTDTSVSW